MKQALTDQYIKAQPNPASGRTEIADVKCTGLVLRITSAGARSWCFRFRDPRSGKTSRSTIGAYPDVGLKDAREAADALRRQVAKGTNPVAAKRQERREVETKTFKALADRYLAEHARRHKKPRSAAEDERNLRKHVLPLWGSRAYDTITRRDVIELLEGIVADGTPVAANRVHAVVSTVFSFAIDCDLVAANPAARLRKRGAEQKRTRILSSDEIRLLWDRAVLPPVSRPVGLALRLALLTGLRASEVTGLARREIEHLDDPAAAALTIAGERTKNHRPHHVPLSPLGADVVREALALAGEKAAHAFPSRAGDGPIGGHVLWVAMRRMAEKMPADAAGAETWRAAPPSPHDIRRTVATRLAELGVPGEDVSAVLSHTRQDITGKVYDKYERAREKRAALVTWAATLSRIIEPGPAADVVVLRSGRPR